MTKQPVQSSSEDYSSDYGCDSNACYGPLSKSVRSRKITSGGRICSCQSGSIGSELVAVIVVVSIDEGHNTMG